MYHSLFLEPQPTPRPQQLLGISVILRGRRAAVSAVSRACLHLIQLLSIPDNVLHDRVDSLEHNGATHLPILHSFHRESLFRSGTVSFSQIKDPTSASSDMLVSQDYNQTYCYSSEAKSLLFCSGNTPRKSPAFKTASKHI